MNRGLGTVAAWLLVTSAVGCGSGPAGTLPAAATSSSPPAPAITPAATLAPTSAPTVATTAAVARPLCAKGTETCSLAPGTYTTAPFTPTFTFTIDKEWTNDKAGEHGGAINNAEGAISWAPGLTKVFVGDVESAAMEDAAGLAAFFAAAAAAGLTVGTPSAVTIGGITGQQVDIERTGEASVGFYNPEGIFGVGIKGRFIVLDTPGTPTLLVVETTGDLARFDAVIAAAQPVIDSIEWQ